MSSVLSRVIRHPFRISIFCIVCVFSQNLGKLMDFKYCALHIVLAIFLFRPFVAFPNSACQSSA